MREHPHAASRRRDERLALIRKLTAWVGGSAAAASLGLGVAFAEAVPGHASTASTPGAAATPSAAANSGSASSGSPRSSSGSSSSASAGASSPAASEPTQLTQPAQHPTHTAAPSVVRSGGS